MSGVKQLTEAISLLKGDVHGSVHFKALENGNTLITAKIYGLAPGKHGFHVHQLGDLSNGCVTAGPHYNPHGKTHGGPHDDERHVGDLGNIVKTEDKEPAEFELEDSLVKLDGTFSMIWVEEDMMILRLPVMLVVIGKSKE
ncbi:superoxide dismutase [Planoprotostelium fungivorum]|uniref:Superoxide dismutase n=1 Tax=Planoprotostelium fungivorum TaxID=1890364 RepID=A0A2P6N4X5_9EUKA|nr:superoxide dismutase [Planoprotostelium fungivorum]